MEALRILVSSIVHPSFYLSYLLVPELRATRVSLGSWGGGGVTPQTSRRVIADGNPSMSHTDIIPTPRRARNYFISV